MKRRSYTSVREKLQKPVIALCLFVLLVVSLNSCIPSVYLNERILVQSIGIDFGNDEFRLTMQAYQPSRAKENVTDVETNTQIVTASGPTLTQALKNAELDTGKQLFYSHSSVLVLGRGLAQKGIDEIVPFFSSDYKVRSNVMLFVSEGDAAEVISLKTENGFLPTSTLEQIAKRAQSAGRVARATTLDLITAAQKPENGFIMPLVTLRKEEGRQPFSIESAVAFRDMKEVCTLHTEQILALQIIRGVVSSAACTVSPKGQPVTIDLTNIECDIEPRPQEGGAFTFAVSVAAEGTITEKQSGAVLNLDEITMLEESLAQKLKDDLVQAFVFAQNAMGCDPFGLYKIAREKAFESYHAIQDDWTAAFLGSHLTAEVTVQINRIGLDTM